MIAADARSPQGTRRTPVEFIALALDQLVKVEDGSSQSAGEFVMGLLSRNGVSLEEGDVLVLSSKVLSFFERDVIRLAETRPSLRAQLLSRVFGKDPRKMELLLRTGPIVAVVPLKWIIRIPSIRRYAEARATNPSALLRGYRGPNAFVLVVRAHAAFLDDAGIDYANTPTGHVSLLPRDPSDLAARIRVHAAASSGKNLAVIVTDTVTSLGRVGTQDVAIGFSGIDPTTRELFSADLFGVPRSGGLDLVVDSIAGMAGLIMGQTTEMVPGVLVRGAPYSVPAPDSSPNSAEDLAYPRGATWKMGLLCIAATAAFLLADLVTRPLRLAQFKSDNRKREW